MVKKSRIRRKEKTKIWCMDRNFFIIVISSCVKYTFGTFVLIPSYSTNRCLSIEIEQIFAFLKWFLHSILWIPNRPLSLPFSNLLSQFGFFSICQKLFHPRSHCDILLHDKNGRPMIARHFDFIRYVNYRRVAKAMATLNASCYFTPNFIVLLFFLK